MTKLKKIAIIIILTIFTVAITIDYFYPSEAGTKLAIAIGTATFPLYILTLVIPARGKQTPKPLFEH